MNRSIISSSAGQIIQIYCGSAGPIKWFFNDFHKLPQNVKVHQNSIYILNIKPFHWGTYECQGVDILGNSFISRQIITDTGETY